MINRDVKLETLLMGGGQERRHRSGTLNVAGCVGTGSAAELAADGLDVEAKHVAELRDELEASLTSTIAAAHVNGKTIRLPNTTNVSFEGAEAYAVLAHLSRVAVSSGSACSSATPAPSHVLLAMGRSESEANSAIRFSLGRESTADDVITAVDDVRLAVDTVRGRTMGATR